MLQRLHLFLGGSLPAAQRYEQMTSSAHPSTLTRKACQLSAARNSFVLVLLALSIQFCPESQASGWAASQRARRR
jgi:hypothetical protein